MFSLYMKILTVCYQKSKETLRKNTSEKYQNLSKEKKTKIENMVVNNIEILYMYIYIYIYI